MRTTSQAKIDEFTAKGWWGDQTISDIFSAAVAAEPSRAALVDAPNRADIAFGQPRRLTFADTQREIDNIAYALFFAGVRQGDRVLVQLPNIVEIVLMYLAIARLGAIISPVPMQYGRHELSSIASTLKPAAVVTLATFKGQNIAELHRPAFSDRTPVLAFGPQANGEIKLIDDLIADQTRRKKFDAYVADLEVSASDTYTICWTSGTTGRPKGVPRSNNHWFSQAYAMDDAVHLNDGEVLLNPFPFVNMAAISGFLFVWLFARATLVLHHPFDLPLMLKQLQDERVAYTIAPPAVLNMLLAKKEMLNAFDLSNLRTICSGSAPLSPWMVKGFKELLNIDVVNTFGSNEGIALVSCAEDIPLPEHR
ncbi:MAG: acyl--CoA ligase, partial [Rhodobacteraceae bacterium]|nr:acyl--CoA ligase [Paracoccaceae bacterium]